MRLDRIKLDYANNYPSSGSGTIPLDVGDIVALIEVADAAVAWEETERAVAIESLPYLGLGPDEVFVHRDKAVKRLRSAILEVTK